MKDAGKIDDPLTHKIIDCAMNVHRTMGNGFQEVIYQRCLAISVICLAPIPYSANLTLTKNTYGSNLGFLYMIIRLDFLGEW